MWYFGPRLRTPRTPYAEGLGGAWRSDEGLLAISAADGPIIVEEPAPSFAFSAYEWKTPEEAEEGDIDEGVLTPVYVDAGGWGCWAHDGGGRHYRLCHTPTYGWSFSTLPAEAEPWEYQGTSAGRTSGGDWATSVVWFGDSFFTSPDLPALGEVATFSPRGYLRRDGVSAGLSLSAYWPRWERTEGADPDSFAGVYAGRMDGTEGAHEIGVPAWGASGEKARSLWVDSATEKYTYGNIKWNGQEYVSGSVGSPSGWYVADPPEPLEEWTLHGRELGPSGEVIPAADTALPWFHYVLNVEPVAGNYYLGEIAECR